MGPSGRLVNSDGLVYVVGMQDEQGREVRVRLVQSSGEQRYAKLEVEVMHDGRVVTRERIELSIEDVGRLVCGLHVEGRRCITAIALR